MVIRSVAGAMVSESVTVLVCAGLPESVTWSVSEDVRLAVGVPVMAPLAMSVRPAGNVPLVIDQL